VNIIETIKEGEVIMATNSGKLYLIAMTSLERLDIQFVPSVLNYSRSASHAEVAIIGRNNPKPQYTGGKTTLTLTLDFYAEEPNRQDVYERVTWLESLAYTDGYNKPKENVMLIFGDMFKRHRWYISNVGIKYSEFNPGYNFLPHQAFVDITLVLDPVQNLTYDDIRYRPVNRMEPLQANLSPKLALPNIPDTSKVSPSNPYADGKIIKRKNGTEWLKRVKVKLEAGYVKDAFYHGVVQGDSLEMMAYGYYGQMVPKGEQYWWLISDLNGVHNPFDLAKHKGKQMIVPNVQEAVFKRRRA
jgi:hypothetical protein